MSTKFFLTTCMSIMTCCAINAMSLTQTEEKPTTTSTVSVPQAVPQQDKTVDHIHDDALVVTAEQLFQETLNLLATLKPTVIITQKHLDDNKYFAYCIYQTITLTDALHIVFTTNKAKKYNKSDDELLVESANQLYSTLQSQLAPLEAQEKKLMLTFYKITLESIISIWAPEIHMPYIRYHTQRLLDQNTIAKIAIAEQTTSKEIA